MKRSILSLIAGALVLTSIAATTNPENKEERKEIKKKVSLVPMEESHVLLKVLKEEKGSVDVKIFSEKGNQVHEESIYYNKSFQKPFDMSKLSAGNYEFEISHGSDVLKQGVFVSQLIHEDVFAIVDELETGLYEVKVFREKVPVKIEIFDGDGVSIFSNIYASEKNFKQQFDLRKLDTKGMRMVITGHKSFISERL